MNMIEAKLTELKTDLAQIREEMVTKTELTDDLARLREEMATKAELADFREENRKEHLDLFVTIRRELRQDLASHIGTIKEALASHLQLILESQQQFVRRDELAELLR